MNIDTFNLCNTYPLFTKSMLNSPVSPFVGSCKIYSGFPVLIKEKIFFNIFPTLVFPVALAPINTIAFLYLKFFLSDRYSPSIVELTIFLGYEKFILNSGKPRMFLNSRFIIIMSSLHITIKSRLFRNSRNNYIPFILVFQEKEF